METNTDYKTLVVYGSQNDVIEIKFNGRNKRIVNILGCVHMYITGSLRNSINVDCQAKPNDNTFNCSSV